MFSLVRVRDAFPHLNGVDQLSRLFKGPADAFGAGSSSIKTPQNIWAIPGHIFISLKDGKRLMVYDFLTKPNPFPESTELLAIGKKQSKNETDAPVLSIFYVKHNVPLVFIILKDGVIYVMTFSSLKMEWTYVTTLYLCKSKKTQIISVCYIHATNEVFWCEKRSPTQCCVCKANIRYAPGQPTIANTEAILHNCPPMQLFSLGYRGLCMKSAGNSPPNVMTIWIHESQQLQVFSFNTSHTEMTCQQLSSDYRNIILETISLWITNDNAAQVVAICTHSDTEELVILDSKMDVHLLSITRAGTIRRHYLCSLDNVCVDDSFRTVDFFAFKFFLGVTLHSGEICVFELMQGKLLWRSELLKSSGPKRLYAKGNIPLVAFWNLSGFWVLKSEPIISQAEVMYKAMYNRRDSGTSRTLAGEIKKVGRDVSTQDKGVIAAHGGNTSESKSPFSEKVSEINTNSERSSLKENNSASYAEGCAFLDVMRYLGHWNAVGTSNEFLIKTISDKEGQNLITKLPIEALESIPDALLSLVLFGDNEKFSEKVEAKLRNELSMHNCDLKKSTCYSGQDTSFYIEEYLNLCEKQREILQVHKSKGSSLHQDKLLPSLIHSEIIEHLTGCHLEREQSSRIHFLFPKDFLITILYFTGVITKDVAKNLTTDSSDLGFLAKFEVTSDLSSDIWKKIISPDTKLFELLCWGFWRELSEYLVSFTTMASKFDQDSVSKECSLYCTKMNIYERCLSALPPAASDLSEKETLVIVEILLLSNIDNADTNAIDLYLNRKCFRQAITLLSGYDNQSEKYRSFFCKILAAAIATKGNDEYFNALCPVIPSTFTALDFCLFLQNTDLDGAAPNIFAVGNKEVRIQSVYRLFEKLLNN